MLLFRLSSIEKLAETQLEYIFDTRNKSNCDRIYCFHKSMNSDFTERDINKGRDFHEKFKS